MGKVYLVGAGPGDEKLITVKGLEYLQKCDAVVYDRLASDELLGCVREDCKKIYVGKQAGKHYKRQEEINEILVQCAQKYERVVRLKGGDSFVFGRGGEEIEALQKYQIPYEVIPGITSAVAVPECAGIPVTHRGVSRSFHVITGHTNTSKGSPDYDYALLAKLEGTLVFLMGLSNLGEIAARLMEAGKDKTTPAAVIANGTTKDQKVVRGTLASIGKDVADSPIPSPAVIVIGETAELSYCMEPCWEEKACKESGVKESDAKGAAGKGNGAQAASYIGVTATLPLQKKIERGFAEVSMQTVPVCEMQLQKTEQIARLRQELQHIQEYHWVVFTSQNAVSIFFEELQQAQLDVRKLGQTKFAVLGSGTAQKLKEYGIVADFIPSRYCVAALAEEFVRVAEPSEKVLFPRAVQGSTEFVQALQEKGIAYCDLAVYDVTGHFVATQEVLEQLDYLVFVSASGVQAFWEEVQKRGICVPKHLKVACIGEITGKRLRRQYGTADIVAKVNDVAGLVRAVAAYEKNSLRPRL